MFSKHQLCMPFLFPNSINKIIKLLSKIDTMLLTWKISLLHDAKCQFELRNSVIEHNDAEKVRLQTHDLSSTPIVSHSSLVPLLDLCTAKGLITLCLSFAHTFPGYLLLEYYWDLGWHILGISDLGKSDQALEVSSGTSGQRAVGSWVLREAVLGFHMGMLPWFLELFSSWWGE